MRKKKKLKQIREMIEDEEKQVNQYKINGNVEMEVYHKGKLDACRTKELIMLISLGQMEDVVRLLGKIMWKKYA